MALFLIRHGETPEGAAGVVQTPEAPLSARGRRQAERLARRLAHAGIGLVLASDLCRARLSAEPLAAASGAPLELEPLLRERDFGALRGTPYAQLAGDLFAPDLAPPGGETWATFHARVDRAWARVQAAAAATRGHLAVVTHGLVCHSLVSRHVRWPAEAGPAPERDRPRRFANGSLTLLEGPPWTLCRLDCTAHLDPAEGGDPRGGRASGPRRAGMR